jgi:transposase
MIRGEVKDMVKEGGRRRHDAEFKREAVRLIVERGLSVKKVAEDLGIHPNMLGNWKRQYLRNQEGSFPGKGHIMPEDKEFQRLKREYADLKEERDILKKALAIFSRQGKGSTGL